MQIGTLLEVRSPKKMDEHAQSTHILGRKNVAGSMLTRTQPEHATNFENTKIK